MSSHGENRGSTGSARDFKGLRQRAPLAHRASPIFLQRPLRLSGQWALELIRRDICSLPSAHVLWLDFPPINRIALQTIVGVRTAPC